MTFCAFDENCSVFDRAMRMPGMADRETICTGCHARSHSELNLLRYDYVDLSQLVPPADRRGEVRIHRPKPESKPPMDMGVFSLRGTIAYTLMITDRALRERLGDSRSTGELTVREGFAVDRAVRYLQPRVYELAAMPATPGYWQMTEAEPLELTGIHVLLVLSSLHHKARRACGLEARSISVPGYCGQCSTPTLIRSDDNPDRIWCRVCRTAMTGAQYLAQQRMVFAPPER